MNMAQKQRLRSSISEVIVVGGRRGNDFSEGCSFRRSGASIVWRDIEIARRVRIAIIPHRRPEDPVPMYVRARIVRACRDWRVGQSSA